MNVSRRAFVGGAATLAGAAALPAWAVAGPSMRFGYAAITWGDNVRGAIDDISAVGFRGIQLRANAVPMFAPAELKALLEQKHLALVALSSGDLSLDKDLEPQLDLHVEHAKWVKAAGGEYLQILDTLKGHPRTATADECTKLGQWLTELGKRTADVGVPLGYHNHLNTLSEQPENLHRILDASDPKYVKLELDVAHATAGGGDPVAEIMRYRDRLLFVHLKDVVPNTEPGARYPFKWVELGQGQVHLKEALAALDKVGFTGWAVVELDSVPVKGRTPKESAEISKKWLVDVAGRRV